MSYSEASYTKGGLYETEPQRLQREADEYTKMLEHERKRYLIMEDQYKQLSMEYDEKKEKIKQMIPSEEDFHM
jgi:biotin synthase-related radical SAM superfamily protein